MTTRIDLQNGRLKKDQKKKQKITVLSICNDTLVSWQEFKINNHKIKLHTFKMTQNDSIMKSIGK